MSNLLKHLHDNPYEHLTDTNPSLEELRQLQVIDLVRRMNNNVLATQKRSKFITRQGIKNLEIIMIDRPDLQDIVDLRAVSERLALERKNAQALHQRHSKLQKINKQKSIAPSEEEESDMDEIPSIRRETQAKAEKRRRRRRRRSTRTSS